MAQREERLRVAGATLDRRRPCGARLSCVASSAAQVGYLNALDWLLFEPGPLRLLGAAPLPPTAQLLAATALPSEEYPSDHVSLCCELEWTDGEGGVS